MTENSRAQYQYIDVEGEKFFTMVLLPENSGTFPTVICRSPYVSDTLDKTEEEILQTTYNSYQTWLMRGYAVVSQHCRGQGKSTGAFVPYVHEREDGLALREWIRRQPFYNGELYLWGASYTASLHYSTAPFEKDVKGAVFEVQDCERYNLWYRNGQMRKGHANWHFGLYKRKCGLNKTYSMQSFSQRPLKDLSERVLGDRAEDFEQMLVAPHPSDEFWNTRFGGRDARTAVSHATIPILLTTGYNDFYVGGMFDMWSSMSEQTREKSAMLVSPYNHGDGYDPHNGLCFQSGKRSEQFGSTYPIDWFDNIRKGTPLPFPKGVITYYRTFENRWQSDFSTPAATMQAIPLGEGPVSFRYDPLRPTAFSSEGTLAQESYTDGSCIRVLTPPLDRDVFIKGNIRAALTVASDCEDSSFFMRISLKNAEHAYVLRHDITSLCFQLGDYRKNDVVELDFRFDAYAFLLKKGEQLQIDIAATDDNTYVPHTNRKGAYHLQPDTEVATNTVYLGKSFLFLPIEP